MTILSEHSEGFNYDDVFTVAMERHRRLTRNQVYAAMWSLIDDGIVEFTVTGRSVALSRNL